MQLKALNGINLILIQEYKYSASSTCQNFKQLTDLRLSRSKTRIVSNPANFELNRYRHGFATALRAIRLTSESVIKYSYLFAQTRSITSLFSFVVKARVNRSLIRNNFPVLTHLTFLAITFCVLPRA